MTITYNKNVEAKRLFVNGLLRHEKVGALLPPEAQDCAAKIEFTGSASPSLAINWRFAESISALQALEATMVSVLLKRKYDVDAPRVVIDTDHAQLFFMTLMLFTIDPNDQRITIGTRSAPGEGLEKYFPSWERHDSWRNLYRAAATNIYKTKDNRYYHLHGSLNPSPTIESLGLPLSHNASTVPEAQAPYIKSVAAMTSAELDHLENDIWRQAGTVCYTVDEYRNCESGKANSHVGLYEVTEYSSQTQQPGWWPSTPQTSAQRPLAGLKVVDLSRIIAAPAISRGLAELGASVMRVVGPHLDDHSRLHPDMSWGKWNTCLDFRKADELEAMRNLVGDADVVVLGYRPGVLDKYGLDVDGILGLVEQRGRGVVIVRENCYGWHGPWSGRSGWQQISDAVTGVSMKFGQAMGLDEAVTPVFPNSDFCTGVCGVVGALDGLLRRAEKGGSYCISVALNYYSQWLVDVCGTYPDDVWRNLWERNGRPQFRHNDPMSVLLPAYMKMMKEKHAETLLREDFFEDRACPVIGHSIRTIKPVLKYPDGEVQLRFNVGTRTNGVDKPYWPSDLTVEVVE